MYLMIKKSMMIHQKIKVEVFINLLFEQGSIRRIYHRMWR